MFIAEMDRRPYTKSMLTAAQIRAGRALLGWKQVDLAERSGVSEIAIKKIERNEADPRGSTLEKIQRAFWESGVEFFDAGQMLEPGGQGVRFRAPHRMRSTPETE